MDIAGFNTFCQPLPQAADVAALQFLFDFTHFFLSRHKLARFSRILVHHHIQGKLHVALDTIRKISDFIATLLRDSGGL